LPACQAPWDPWDQLDHPGSVAQAADADRREGEDRRARPAVPDPLGDKDCPDEPGILACLARLADREENILKTI